MNVVDFSPRMRHAGGFRDAPVLIQRVVAPIRISLQDTAVPGQVLLRMDALAVR